MRTFIAIEVNAQDVLNSIHKIQTELNIKAKPVELHNLHFTVQFLGEISEEMERKISDALNSIEFSIFSISFASIGVFPNPRVKTERQDVVQWKHKMLRPPSSSSTPRIFGQNK